MALPTVAMEGRLVNDPELRFTQAGKAYVRFTVACNDRRKNPDTGEWEDADTCFIDVTVWSRAAENVADSLGKGDLATITGTLRQDKWQAEDGSNRSKHAVDVNDWSGSIGTALRFRSTPHSDGPSRSSGDRPPQQRQSRGPARQTSTSEYEDPPF